MKEYKNGFSFSIFFGEENKNQSSVNFYGDVNHFAAPWAMDAACAEVPAQAQLAACQTVAVFFKFNTIRKYGEIIDLFDKVMTQLEATGWLSAPAIEGFPDTGCCVNYLVDTDTQEYWGKPENDWPTEPGAHGFNAARGFTLVVEKPGTKPEFSEYEIREVMALAKIAQQMVFGCELEESYRV